MTLRRMMLLVLTALLLACSNGVKPPPEPVKEQWGIMPLRAGNEWKYDAYRIDSQTGELGDRYEWGDWQYGIVGDTTLVVDGISYDAFYFSYYGILEGRYYTYKRLYTNAVDGLWCLGGMGGGDTLINRTLLYKYPIAKGDTFTQLFPRYHLIEKKWCYPDTLLLTCTDDNAWFHSLTDSILCVVYNYKQEQAEDVSAWLDYYEYYHVNVGCVGRIIKSYLPISGRNYYKYKEILSHRVILNGE